MPIQTAIDSISNNQGSPFGFKNRIINGGMVIDQRNAGASVTSPNGYQSVDRWKYYISTGSKFNAQQVSDAPDGFTNSLKVTSSSAYSVTSGDFFSFVQAIEGYNFSDFAFGTSASKPVTISFWVKSTLTGTFGGNIGNKDRNRQYYFTYTISSANTWEYKTVTIPGDTTGTWYKNNDVGLLLEFSIGAGTGTSVAAGVWTTSGAYSVTGAVSVVGTNAATWQITGVQVEKGSTATSFDYRPYGYELALCQRYYFKSQGSISDIFGVGFNESTTQSRVSVFFPVSMRIEPTALEQSGTASDYSILYSGSGAGTCSAVPVFSQASTNSALSAFTVASGLSAGQGSIGRQGTANAYLAWSAEL